MTVKHSQLTQTTLTDEEAASCSRTLSSTELLQARVDGAICTSYDGREFKNRYTCADGTERRQFEVTATHVQCALCRGDAPFTLSSQTPWKTLLHELKTHAGHFSTQNCPRTQTHLKRLFESAGAPLPTTWKRPRTPTPREHLTPEGWGYSAPSDDAAGPAKRHRTRSSTPQNVPWRAVPPSDVFAAPSSARFVPAKRWPEAGEECQFLAEGNWYSGRCDEATEARVVLLYAERHNIRGQAHVLIKDDDKPAECIRLREDAPELPANIV